MGGLAELFESRAGWENMLDGPASTFRIPARHTPPFTSVIK